MGRMMRSLELLCLLRIANLVEKAENAGEEVYLTANLNNSLSTKLLMILMRRGLLTDKIVKTLLASIDQVDSLREIHLIETKSAITNAGLDILLKKLNSRFRKLVLDSNRFVDTHSLVNISKYCPNLLHLELKNCHSIDDTGVGEVCKECKFLEIVNFAGCVNLGNDALIAISQLRNLKSVNLSKTKIDDQGIEQFLRRIRSEHFKRIILSSCNLITNTSIELILRVYSGARITYYDCPKIEINFSKFDHLVNIDGWTHKH